MSTVDNSKPQEQLSERDLVLLRRLLSDPTRLPESFWVGLIARVETSDMNIPMSTIVGLDARLKAINARLAALEAA